jgi:hypothetical protein
MKTPLKSVREYCVKVCCIDQPNEVLLCPAKDCLFWKYRFGKGRMKLKTIKERCDDCGEGGFKARKGCEFPDCPLFHFRLGKNPNKSGQSNSGSFSSRKTTAQSPK